MYLKKCDRCGAVIKVFNDCVCDNCGIRCCDQVMRIINANSEDAAFEKHMPDYEKVNDEIIVRINHTMEEDHYIEWIGYEFDNSEQIIYFNFDDEPIVTFKYVKGATIYSYCNKHSLWSRVVE